MHLAAGTRLGPYEVISPLGAGGMGEVYRARHLKLGRDVAIKVLPSELGSDPDRLRRFEREARTASALNHANIVTIHDINEHDGTHYIAMELVKGRTLRELLSGAPLPVVHLLALARQIAEGLSKAHAAGIVHRDLKPENLMVTDDGLAKILDFGLAKLTPTAAEAGAQLNTVEELTRTGVLLGTVSYMSPEQAAGRPVDFQSDQFSFGSILYEMATGRRAFKKETKPQTLAAIIETEPEPFVNGMLPAAFIAIVKRCLAKDPGKRFASTRELASALQAVPEGTSSVQTELEQARQPKKLPGAVLFVGALGLLLLAGLGAWAWRARGVPASHVMLAVLPFENFGSDPEREYLADGLTDDTIASLGQIDPEHISVIGRTSTMAYKGTRKSLATIGAELNVNYLVESSLRAEAGRLRVTAKLIRVRDQVQVWAETYDREPTSLLALQRELSTAVAEQIRLRLSPERLAALERRHTRNADAYDLYLRGRYLSYQLTPPTTQRAIEYYQQATRLDPDYALAWSGLADAYAASPINGDAPPLQVWPRVRETVAEAIRAEPNLAEAQTSLGLLKFWLDWDLPAAEAAYRRSVTLDPSYSHAHRHLGIVLSHMGRHGEARTALRRARELDPLSPINQAFSGAIEVSALDPAAAVSFARQAIVIDPQQWVGHYQLAHAYEQMGSTDLALEALSSAARLSNSNSKTLSLRGYVSAKAGKPDAAREALALLVAVSRERYVPPYAMALVHAGLGERDAVFGWLDKAYAAHDVHLLWLLSDPKWAPYRADPRFLALVARCGFTPTATTAASKP